jgi:DNA-binding NarL/FixJ family response regulator
MTIRIAIVDDHELVRAGLRKVLSGGPIEVVAEAGSAAEAAQTVGRSRPDVLLLDVRLPDRDGLDVLERILEQSPRTKVVLLSAYENPTYLARAVALGACDYLLKGASGEQILSAVVRAAGQEPPLRGRMREVAELMAATPEAPENGHPLTPRELQVLRHLALGLSNREISRSLDISVETVKEHVQNALQKIGAVDRTAAAVWAAKQGLAGR